MSEFRHSKPTDDMNKSIGELISRINSPNEKSSKDVTAFEHKRKETLRLDAYNISTLNLIIERHLLAAEKRTLFSIRFATDDKETEAKLTEEMDKLSIEISEIDEKLSLLGISDKQRTSLLKLIKKTYPNEWMGGLA